MIKKRFSPMFIKIFVSLINANLVALFISLSLANEIAAIASNPTINAKH